MCLERSWTDIATVAHSPYSAVDKYMMGPLSEFIYSFDAA
jgi:hypothetical protein